MAVETKVSKVNAPVSERDAQNLWQKWGKPASVVLAAAIIGLGAWFAYDAWVVQPKEEKAQDAIYKAQEYYGQDSLRKALDGDGVNKGFLAVIKNYSGTKSANLARYYVGVCDLRLGSFSEAVKYLSDFSTDSKPAQMQAYGCLGDAYGELNKRQEAVDAYKKAASAFTDDKDNTAEYLFRAALMSEVMGKNKEALDMYKEIKDKYPGTARGAQVDKYIYRLNVEPNDFSVN